MASEMITPDQRRALHALGRARGYDHDGLHDLAGVESLNDLTRAEASQLIDALSVPVRAPALIGSRYGEAQPPQRKKIHWLLCQLRDDCSWPWSKCVGWLMKRHGLQNAYDHRMLTGQASEIISQLENTVASESLKIHESSPAPDGGKPHVDQ